MTVQVSMPSREDLQRVAPALDRYTQECLLGDVWKRPGLNMRDRSIVTLAALIARNQNIAIPFYLNLALDNGVKPREISEIITHLAFYTGWANAMPAVIAAKDVFAARNIGTDQLPVSKPALLPLDETPTVPRGSVVNLERSSPASCSTRPTCLFRDLWLRPDLAPRDRSLVTISALIANGQVAQLTGHIPIGMNNGLTQDEIAEAITHLAFYVGWPNVFSAMPVAKEVFEKRPK